MKEYYRRFYRPMDENETDLPVSEYFKFVKFWDIVVFLSDIFTLVSTIEIIFLIQVRVNGVCKNLHYLLLLQGQCKCE